MELEFFNGAHCIRYPSNVSKNVTFMFIALIVKKILIWYSGVPKFEWNDNIGEIQTHSNFGTPEYQIKLFQ